MLATVAARSSQYDYGEEKEIEDLFRMHSSSSCVVELYTQDSPFFRVLNRILRQQRHDLIYRILPIINDLINHLRQSLSHQDKNVSFTLYRGQQMTIFEIEKLKNNIGE